MNKMTVILADDHTLVRKGIKAMLESDEDIEVVAEAGNGLEALEKAREFNPDLLIMDVRMPVMTGLDACGLLSGYAPRTKALIDRKSVVSGKRVSVRVDLGGRRSIK